MGLAAAFYAVKAGHTVEVLEAAREPGGMAAHFDLAGLSIERFYHFVCKSDTPTMELMDELGIRQLMRGGPHPGMDRRREFPDAEVNSWLEQEIASCRFDDVRHGKRLGVLLEQQL